jgi:adenylate cyclase
VSDVFISYARSTENAAKAIGEALRGLGYGVWRDDEIPAHRAFAEVIEERLSASKAVIVVWSADALVSEWVRSEANRARTDRKLIQLRIDETRPPMPFDQIQCADLMDWTGEADHPGWAKVAASVGELIGGAVRPTHAVSRRAAARSGRPNICVLPFANMSGDPEQEYFSDGISEDIITDLSKVSALEVTARNTAFTFKGKAIAVPEVARKLGVSHVLEGSVRKAGNRVRITAQLIDGASGNHLWAERYDRDLDDIFALQDEISEAIVKALKLKLLPREKAAIERRGTNNVDAYNLYLMARSYWLTGNAGDPRQLEEIERLARRAVDIDRGYGLAWALMAFAQQALHRSYGRDNDVGEAALGRALALNPDLAEAHALKAWTYSYEGRSEEAASEIALALRLDPESWDVNYYAAYIAYEEGRLEDAARQWEKALTLGETDVRGPIMLLSCYTVLGDRENARRVARITLERAEEAVARDRSNGMAMSAAVTALATLGEADRAKDWVARALMIDPDNLMMRYNFACTLSVSLADPDAALDMLESVLEHRGADALVRGCSNDPDLASLRDHPRFQAMLAAAEARLVKAETGEA